MSPSDDLFSELSPDQQAALDSGQLVNLEQGALTVASPQSTAPLTAMQTWCQEHQATPLTEELFYKNSDGSPAFSCMFAEVGNADGMTKDIVELVWVPARSRLVTVPLAAA